MRRPGGRVQQRLSPLCDHAGGVRRPGVRGRQHAVRAVGAARALPERRLPGDRDARRFSGGPRHTGAGRARRAEASPPRRPRRPAPGPAVRRRPGLLPDRPPRHRVLRRRPPSNDLRRNGSYLSVERWADDGSWVRVADDGDWSTVLRWARSGGATSIATLTWNIPWGTAPGTYRLAYHGDHAVKGPFTGVSEPFEVG
ncbi:neutral/alkaline non-lysosomal ceramidase C-terminal domain-containing protein [Streptomyces sp. Edi4]|uniref:neutral/alkaline non-lysosomal ceramidase C-terminal domain-containing protein n=1 Tax=Streptomyces sp. Edi4 TaxID=3162527 RepID=UPI0033057371